MSNKKILIISSEFPPNVGGIGNHAFNIAKYLQINNYEVTVLTDLIEIDKNTYNNFIKTIAFKLIPIYRKKLVIISYFNRIINAIKYAKKSEVVICSGKFPLWVIQILKLFFSKKHYVAVVHGSELLLNNKNLRSFTNNCLAKFNKIIAVSSFTKSLLPQQLQKNAVVIPNGINNSEFQLYYNEAKKDNTFNQQLNLVTVGSVTERKGQENIIKALPKILQDFPHAKYHIIGKPVIKEKLQKIIEVLKLNDYVTFYGAVDRNFLIEQLSKCDIKLMLSNNTNNGDVEGFGIAVLEANALGLPAIGSNNNGIVDAIAVNKTGELVNPCSAEEITNAISNILANYSNYSDNAKEWAMKHDWLLLIKKYIAVVEN